MSLRRITSRLDRQELSSTKSTQILLEEEARKKYILEMPPK
jgi:hypothetical protein